MDIKFTSVLKADDYVVAQLFNRTARSLVSKTCFVFIFFAALAFALGDPNWWMAGGLWAIIWLTFMLLWRVVYFPMRARKDFAQDYFAALPTDVELTDTEYRWQSSIGNMHLPWNSFHKWKANPRIIMIYQSDRQFQILSRRFFASDEDYAALQATLTREIGPMGKPRRR